MGWHWSSYTWYLAMMRVFLQGSVENVAANQPDMLFIVHTEDSAVTTCRIRSYMLFPFCCNNNDVIMHFYSSLMDVFGAL